MGTFFQELLSVGVYKRTQGRLTRQVTFAALAVAVGLGLFRLSAILAGKGSAWQYALPAILLAAGVWVCYRVVNIPAFADFLIAVEAEMNKVSWPSRTELFRASMVVIILIFALGFILAAYDMFWATLLRRVLHIL